MVPSSLSSNFFKHYLDGIDYLEDNGVFYIDCLTKDMKDLWFMFEEHWIEIKADDILTDISEKQDNSLCVFNFLPSVDNFWVFGNTIYKDYYVTHDPEQGMMKWVPTSYKLKTALKKGKVPTATMEFSYNNSSFLKKILVALAVGAGTAATAHFVFTKTFTGVSFLNQTSRKKQQRTSK